MPLYGNELDRDDEPARGRPRLGREARQGRLRRARAPLARVSRPGRGASSSASSMREDADRAPRLPGAPRRRAGRRGHERHALADARRDDRDGLRAGRTPPASAPSSRSWSASARIRAEQVKLPFYKRPALRSRPPMSRYPEDLRYSKEHEWVRVDGFDGHDRHHQLRGRRARRHRLRRAAGGRGRPEPVRDLRRRREREGGERPVRAALGRRSTEVNAALGDQPELLNSDPYGDGWIAQVELADDGELDAAARRRRLRRAHS